MKNTIDFTIAHSFIKEMSLTEGNFSNSLTKAINENNFLLKPSEIVLKKNVTAASSEFRLLNVDELRSPGINDFEKSELPTNQAFVVTKIAAGYQTDGATDKEGALVYDRKMIGELANARLEINQRGQQLLGMGLKAFANVNTGSNVEDQYTKLSGLVLFSDGKELKKILNFPKNVSVPATGGTTEHYLELRYNGFWVRVKGS